MLRIALTSVLLMLSLNVFSRSAIELVYSELKIT